MDSKKINQLATEVAPVATDLTIIGNPTTGVSKKITLLQLASTIGVAATLQQITDNGATTTNAITIGGLSITGFSTGVLKSTSGVISSIPYGAANGVATLAGDGKVPSNQLPSYVDDVVEVANYAALPVTGETGKIYITLDNNKVYRWTGSIYVEIAPNNAVWGAITGTLSNQTDLQNALNAKLSTATAASTYVPYTGANASVDLGLFNLSSTSVLVTGTAGSGHIHFRNQSSTPNGLTNYMTMYSNAAGTAIGIINTGGNAALLSISSLSANRTFTFPNASGTLALTSDISYPVSSVFGRTGAVVATSGDYTTDQVTEGSTNLYFTNTRARAAISLTTTGTSGASTYNNTTGVLNIPNYADQYVGTVTSVAASAGTGISISGSPITTSGTLTITNTAPDQTVVLTASTGISVTGSYPSFTITNTSPSSGGTVTSVAALTLGTSGTDLSSSVATGTTTPVITLNVPTASAANRGALSSTDWTTFNNKQSALTNPVTGTGTTNYLPKFTGASTIGNSIVSESGSALSVAGSIQVSTGTYLSGVAKLYTSATYGTILTGFAGSSSDMLLTDRSGNIALQVLSNSSTPNIVIGNNLGLGVTPSAWNLYKAMQVQAASIANFDTSDNSIIGSNIFYGGSPNDFRYISTGTSTMYRLNGGVHSWYNASSGTAGNAISFTQAMTLDASGNFMVGNTTNNGAKVVFKGANSTPATTGTTTGAVLRLSSGTGLYNVLDFGTNESLDYSWIQSTRANSLGTYDYLAIQPNGGNLLVGTTTNSTYKLDVNGTGRFSGALTALSVTTTAISSVAFYSGTYVSTSLGDGSFGTYSSRIRENTSYGLNIDLYDRTAATWRTPLSFNNTGGAATFSSSVTATSFIPSYSTSYFGTDGTISNYSATNYMYVNGTGGLRLKAEGVGYQKIVLEGGTSNDIFFTTANVERLRIASTGAATFSSTCTATGFFESSDSRLKTLIQDNYQTKGIASITPKLYTKNGKVELGYYAQDLVGILDSAVSKGSDEMLNLSYREVLVAKVYALEQRIKELETK